MRTRESCGRGRGSGVERLLAGVDFDALVYASNDEGKMKERSRIGLHGQWAGELLKAVFSDGDGVIARGDGVDLEASFVIAGSFAVPVRLRRAESDRGAFNGAVLRVVNDSAHGAKDARTDRGRDKSEQKCA